MDTTETLPVDYLEDQLVKDVAFRQDLLSRVCKVRQKQISLHCSNTEYSN